MFQIVHQDQDHQEVVVQEVDQDQDHLHHHQDLDQVLDQVQDQVLVQEVDQDQEVKKLLYKIF